jgi:hypothetical protein
MREIIYTLRRVGPNWVANYAILTSDGYKIEKSALEQQTFKFRAEAEAWLLQCAKVLSVPYLPDKVPPTRLFFALGGVLLD